jgi:NAD(P)-dependent dehydrogenase (short-subunit alcohol dehydrogenase family)
VVPRASTRERVTSIHWRSCAGWTRTGSFPFRLDVTDSLQIAAAAEASGDVDVVVSNAGVTCFTPILAAPDVHECRQTMEVNYFGTTNLLRAFAGQVRERQGGIVLILSVAAVALSRSAPGYSASKAAALMLGSSVREELREVPVSRSLWSRFGSWGTISPSPGPIKSSGLRNVEMSELGRTWLSQAVATDDADRNACTCTASAL